MLAVSALLVLAACDGFTEGQLPTTATGGYGGQGAAGGQGGAAGQLRFLQAVDGGMLVNPDAYERIVVRLEAPAGTGAVVLTAGEQVVQATPDGDGRWAAEVQVSSLPAGTASLAASAMVDGATVSSAAAELVVSTTGAQLSDFFADGFAGAPRLHRREGALWVTFTDRHEPAAEAWLRRLDGAGRWVGERIRLVGADEETLYARTALGDESIGVLYQSPGEPYSTHFKVVGFDGSERLAPMDLDPPGRHGSFGGDIDFDGEAFVSVWRVNDEADRGQVRWLRVDEMSLEATGPVVVASSGAGTVDEPEGSFPPFSFVAVQPVGARSLVAFVRGRYEGVLGEVVPKSQIAAVDNDGTVAWTRYAGIENDLTWHREARLFPYAERVLALWSATDLTAPGDMPPNWFYATLSDADGELDPLRGKGELVVDGVDDRDEPAFVEHPSLPGVLAWVDHRAYTLDPANGQLDVYAAPLDDALYAAEPAVFKHAKPFAGLTQLGAAVAGTNVVLVWRDQRHSQGLDGIMELWFDTVWL
jgi:hypothetical protein